MYLFSFSMGNLFIAINGSNLDANLHFGQDDSIIEKSGVRTPVGVKEKSGNSIVCYCFGVTSDDASKNPEAKTFVIEKTKGHICECAIKGNQRGQSV